MSELMQPWEIENEAFAKGYTAVCGVDEAGAGPLAGPVYAAAVILPPGLLIDGLNDSKKLSAKKREQLFDSICADALAYGIASASVEEIEEINILNARLLAMERAIAALPTAADFALIDGNCNRGISCPNAVVVGGDGKSASIAAASVLAKVSRDRYVTQVLDRDYPQYQFARHKGYGTKLHYAMLEQYGVSPVHRPSFLKKWEARR
ncbi:MAG: ribonuclease HII [Oscillospiraceae bacterium]